MEQDTVEIPIELDPASVSDWSFVTVTRSVGLSPVRCIFAQVSDLSIGLIHFEM